MKWGERRGEQQTNKSIKCSHSSFFLANSDKPGENLTDALMYWGIFIFYLVIKPQRYAYWSFSLNDCWLYTGLYRLSLRCDIFISPSTPSTEMTRGVFLLRLKLMNSRNNPRKFLSRGKFQFHCRPRKIKYLFVSSLLS